MSEEQNYGIIANKLKLETTFQQNHFAMNLNKESMLIGGCNFMIEHLNQWSSLFKFLASLVVPWDMKKLEHFLLGQFTIF